MNCKILREVMKLLNGLLIANINVIKSTTVIINVKML